MKVKLSILFVLVTMLATLPGVAQKAETNYCAQIPFLCSTSSVEQLSQHLNDPSLLPIRRFNTLCSMFVNNVYVGSSLTNFANAAKVQETKWGISLKFMPMAGFITNEGQHPM